VRLACWNNKLTALPKLPASLKDLGCSNNKLTGIDLTPCQSLRSIDCSYNDMTNKGAVKGFDRWDDSLYKYEPQNVQQAKTIFSTGRESTFLNWFLFIVCFGWIWMWF
jgi:hypothetical protein